MTPQEAVEKLVERTGVERSRHLAFEHPDPTVRAQYRAFALAQEAGEPYKAPGVVKQATSLVRAVVRHAANGFAWVPADVLGQRLAVCASCEFHDGGRCGKCGCFVVPKAKMASESCPAGKWPAIKSGGKCGSCGSKS